MRRLFFLRILTVALLWFCPSFAGSQEIGHLHALLIDPQKGALLMGAHHGLYESRDEGKSWKKRSLKGNIPGSDFMLLAADPTNSKTLYAGGHDLAVIKSDDGGFSWQRAAKGLPTMDIHGLAVDPTNGKKLYAWAVDHGLFRSDSGAQSWARVDDGPENPHVTGLTSVPIPTGMGGIFLYASTAAGLYRNADCF